MDVPRGGKVVLLVFIFMLLGIPVHIVLMKILHHEYKAIVVRAEFVIVVETIMVLLSVMVWRTLSPHLKKPCSTSSHRNFEQTAVSSKETNHVTLGRRSLRETKGLTNVYSILSAKYTNLRRLSFLEILLLIYMIITLSSYLTNLVFISKEPHWYGMLAYACLGSFLQLVFGIFMGNIISIVVGVVRYRNFLQLGLKPKIVASFAVLYAFSASVVGVYVALQPPTVRHVDIPVRDLPHNIDGLTVVQISDIHLGPTVGYSKLNMIVDIVNQQKPDVVVMTGDLVDGSVNSLKRAAEPLSRVTSVHGNFYVTGNHEYYTGDVENWFSYLRSLSFVVLHNSNIKIPSKVSKGQGQICMAGTDDIQADRIGYKGHGFDITSAVDGCNKSEPVILLAHQPKAAKMALDSKHRIDLVLSGHTHGGQIFPLQLAAYLLNPFYLGLVQYGPAGSHVYVCEGTQYWGIPMRIGTNTEITRITLIKAKGF